MELSELEKRLKALWDHVEKTDRERVETNGVINALQFLVLALWERELRRSSDPLAEIHKLREGAPPEIERVLNSLTRALERRIMQSPPASAARQ